MKRKISLKETILKHQQYEKHFISGLEIYKLTYPLQCYNIKNKKFEPIKGLTKEILYSIIEEREYNYCKTLEEAIENLILLCKDHFTNEEHGKYSQPEEIAKSKQILKIIKPEVLI